MTELFKLLCSEDVSAVFNSSDLPIGFSSEHEMKLGDPITTEYGHTINTKGWDGAGFHLALIHQPMTEVKAPEQVCDKHRKVRLSHKG